DHLEYLRSLNEDARRNYKSSLRKLVCGFFAYVISIFFFAAGYFLCPDFALAEVNFYFIILIKLFSGYFIGTLSASILNEAKDNIIDLKDKLNYCVKCDGKGYVDSFELLNPAIKTVIDCNVCK